ncbi:MAG: hypothetical protein IPM79_24255 [Polyangiaceae bacterium]|nr:hypothetical protein [Polyangiaceae bacterium]MBK8940641.1 hypothetical protein [Polyangiaceae bacterium]
MRHASLLALVLVASFVAACGDSSVDPGGGPEGGSGQGGEAAGGGGASPCPIGSHDDGDGACIASLGAFEVGPQIADERDHHMTWAAKRASGTYLYVAGGYADMTTPVDSIERAVIAQDGTLGPWETLPSTSNVSGAAVVATDEVVVFAGGFRATSSSTRNVDIFTIGDDGTLSEPIAGPLMADPRFHGAGVLTGGFFYAVGGLDASGSSLASVERASLDGTTLGAWSTEAALPVEVSHHGLATDGEALYVTGGLKRVDNDFGNDVPYDAVLRARLAEDGSLESWEEIGTLPVPLAVHASFVHAGELYVVGGLDMQEERFVGTLQRAKVSADGPLGEWEELDVTLPRPRGHTHQTPIVDGVLYSVAGHQNGASQRDTYFARFE